MKSYFLQVILCSLIASNAFSASFQPQNYGNNFMNSFNQTQEFMLRQRQMEQMNQEREYQQQRIKIEEQRLDIEKKTLELRSRQAKEAKTAENLIVWNNFISRNPSFADVNSKQRKYGDYLFDKEYTYKMESGELTYIQALNAVAVETYKAVGGSSVNNTIPPEIPALLLPVAGE